MSTLINIALVMFFAAGIAFSQAPAIGPGVSHDLAVWRAAHYSDVRYKLNLTLEKMSPVLKGSMEIRVNVRDAGAEKSSTPYEGGVDAALGGRGGSLIILDWRKIRGSETSSTIANVSINGQSASMVTAAENHPVGEAPTPLLRKEGSFLYEESNEHLIFREGVKVGENVIRLDFTSPILTSGSAITRYVDKEDGSEYLYSLFVPSDASTAFPVFDQPDLKARFQMDVLAPNDWLVVSNTPSDQFRIKATEGPVIEEQRVKIKQGVSWERFPETKPISTYVFAFAAGPWKEFADEGTGGGNPSRSEGAQRDTPSNVRTLPTGRVSASDATLPSHIYVRKSQAEKFKPHAAEVFRLTREGIKYLEGYFDYKFPWPKYDIVLIPEFPFGGMEHAGATFVREQSIIFPTEPTKSDYINRATLIFHETAHQWFGDCVTMKWFDDLWLKEGFAQFMAYKTLEKVMPEANAWKVFYERIKQPAYATDSTKGTTAIYQPIKNLSAAKSAYGNIVYNKAPAFLRQAEFYLGPDKFQTAVRTFLKKHEYSNATWEDLVKEFETASAKDLKVWANSWVTKRGVPIVRTGYTHTNDDGLNLIPIDQSGAVEETLRPMVFNYLLRSADSKEQLAITRFEGLSNVMASGGSIIQREHLNLKTSSGELPRNTVLAFPNIGDYGYGIFLLDDKSRDYVLKNIQNEKDPFLRSMMYGALWDSVREGELDPKEYVELVTKNLSTESDETILLTILGRSVTALNYYVSDKTKEGIVPQFENVLIDRLTRAETPGQRITLYRAFLNVATTANGRDVLRAMIKSAMEPVENIGKKPFAKGLYSTEDVERFLRFEEMLRNLKLKPKDKFDIITRLAILGDPEAPKLLADLEKTETGDDAKRYAYAAHAAFATKENREKFWNDFVNNKTISESWIEAAIGPFNSIRHDDLSLPYLLSALAELPNLKRDRKIFFVNGWLGAFIGGQKSQAALDIVNKFLADNPNLDNDLRLKILENVDLIERAVKIRSKFGK